jgi:2'-5' RNA ligase
LRLFVACDIPAVTQDAIARWQRRSLEVRRELRLNHALHITLCFLGDRDPGVVPRLIDALTSISWEPVTVRLEGAMFLPRHGRRNVVALSLSDPDGTLAALHQRVNAELAAAGDHEPERRPWTPHVTAARFRRPGQPFPLQNVNIPEFCVVRMALYSSSLESTGAVHTPLAVFPAS